jgi:prevent-host-death family protein
MKVSARALKNRFDEYLVRVRAGEHVVVTVRGEPVAEIVPIRCGRRATEQALARMAESGELTRANGKGLQDLEPVRPRAPASWLDWDKEEIRKEFAPWPQADPSR